VKFGLGELAPEIAGTVFGLFAQSITSFDVRNSGARGKLGGRRDNADVSHQSESIRIAGKAVLVLYQTVRFRRDCYPRFTFNC
jgi:hypothetical protein